MKGWRNFNNQKCLIKIVKLSYKKFKARLGLNVFNKNVKIFNWTKKNKSVMKQKLISFSIILLITNQFLFAQTIATDSRGKDVLNFYKTKAF